MHPIFHLVRHHRARTVGAVLLALAVVGIPLAIWAYTSFPTDTDGNLPIGYVAQDEVTSFNLVDAGGFSTDQTTGAVTNTPGLETLFRPEYNREKWSGNLHAYPIDAAGNLYPTKRWSAATPLAAQSWDTGRFIATLNSASTSAGIAFRGALPAAVKVNTVDYTATQVLNYLRGDTSNDDLHGGQLRARASPLGDIIHSRPFYVEDASNPTVFVGANDGMLHAFNADTGAERWAYVPSMLLSKLHTLAYSPQEAAQPYKHGYFVDGQINVGSIRTSGGSTLRALFGGLGAGGKGLYALDVSDLSNPATEASLATKVLWEITPDAAGTSSTRKRNGQTITTSTDYSRLGYTYGTPLLVKINTSSGATASSVDALVVGNGYDDGAAGVAHLYVINAATGALMKDFAVGPYSSLGGANGIFNPKAIDTDKDGNIDRVYAADLNGSLWKFDLSAPWTSSASWTAPAAPLFSNKDTVSGSYQPVTSSLGVAAHPKGGYLVTFGTGSTLNGAYGTYASGTWNPAGTGELTTSSPVIHFVYGIWDGAPGSGTIVPADLLTQTLTERSYGTNRVRRASANTPNWSSHKGWKIALPAGERVVGEGGFIENGRFYFNSYNPKVPPYRVAGTNTDIYGENWLMELNYLTGGSSASPFLDLDNNLLLNDADRIAYVAGDTIPSGKAVGDRILSPNEDGIPVGKFISTGVQSQPILVQLVTLNTTLLNQNPDVLYPATTTVDRGVAGGHFDVDYFNPLADCTNLTGMGTQAEGSVKFTFSSNGRRAVAALTIKVGNEVVYSRSNLGNYVSSGLDDDLDGWSSANYVLRKNYNGDNSTVGIYAINPGTAYNGAVSVTFSSSGSAPGYIKTDVTGGTNPTGIYAATASTICDYSSHDHEYDDQFDKTGVNFLNPSDSAYRLSNAIPSTSTAFKVLVMNQYLNPALQLHIGRSDYVSSSSTGYVPIKSYQTGANLQLSNVPSYTRSTIGSLVLNMPADAFKVTDWWGGSPTDPRVGLMPTSPQCVTSGLLDANGNNNPSLTSSLYNPVNPPANGATGAGTPSTNPGVRHNGAITLQIIRATTPQSALEENLTGRPEYGYRVNAANHFNYVLAEYSLYWHHPRRVCFGDSSTTWYNGSTGGNGYFSSSNGAWNTSALMVGTGWTKNAPSDTKTSTANTAAVQGSTDPKIGTLGQNGGTVASVTSTVAGNITTTTIVYVDGTSTVIVSTANSNSTLTLVTTQKNAQGQTVGTPTTVTVADASGSVKTGGDERGLIARTGRISWRELVRP